MSTTLARVDEISAFWRDVEERRGVSEDEVSFWSAFFGGLLYADGPDEFAEVWWEEIE